MAEKKRRRLKMLFVLFLFLASLFLSPFIGIIDISPLDLFKGDLSASKGLIFWQIRLPRALLAAFAGAGLSVSGLITQSLLRNPLATPYTLGISSGSALGAVVAIKLSLDFYIWGFSPLFIFAFGGSLLTGIIIYLFSLQRKNISTFILILAGVTISYIISAVNLLIQYFSDFTETRAMVKWLMGGLETIGYQNLAPTGIATLAGICVIFFFAKDINILSLGNELAMSKGVDVEKVMKILFIVVAIIVASIVSVVGPIGFVGLIVPHALRLWIGPDNRFLIPASVFSGAAFLIISDTFARMILAPVELPVGIITAIVGGPLFIMLLLKRRKELLA